MSVLINEKWLHHSLCMQLLKQASRGCSEKSKNFSRLLLVSFICRFYGEIFTAQRFTPKIHISKKIDCMHKL